MACCCSPLLRMRQSQLEQDRSAGCLASDLQQVVGCRSWGPLGLLSASEVTPLPARSAGLALGLSINFFLSFCLGQVSCAGRAAVALWSCCDRMRLRIPATHVD